MASWQSAWRNQTPTPPRSLPAVNRRAELLRGIRRNWTLYLLLLPSLIAALVFYYYPMVSGFYHSFTYWDIKRTVWIGLENYQRMFEDPITLAAWRNMATLLIANICIVLTLPLLGAALVRHVRSNAGQFWWRMLFVLPIVVPGTVIVFVWRWFYGMDGGLNIVLRAIGLGSITRWWLGDPHTALWGIIFVAFPWIAGLNFLVYLAALQSISTELLDAATGRWRRSDPSIFQRRTAAHSQPDAGAGRADLHLLHPLFRCAADHDERWPGLGRHACPRLADVSGGAR